MIYSIRLFLNFPSELLLSNCRQLFEDLRRFSNNSHSGLHQPSRFDNSHHTGSMSNCFIITILHNAVILHSWSDVLVDLVTWSPATCEADHCNFSLRCLPVLMNETKGKKTDEDCDCSRPICSVGSEGSHADEIPAAQRSCTRRPSSIYLAIGVFCAWRLTSTSSTKRSFVPLPRERRSIPIVVIFSPISPGRRRCPSFRQKPSSSKRSAWIR